MQVVLLILAALQIAQSAAPASAVGDRFQLAVPQGWKVLSAGEDVLLSNSTGASLLVVRVQAQKDLHEYARLQAERVMAPLGFAKLSDPRDFKNARDEWVEYEIRGNRLADHRRILYRALRHDGAYFSMVFEASEDDYEALLTDAQNIASSVQATFQSPTTRRPAVRRTRR